MHRTLLNLRSLGCSLLATWALHLGMSHLPAQEAVQQKDAPLLPMPAKSGEKSMRVFTVAPNITKTIGMSRAPAEKDDPIIQKVHNENPKIIRVQSTEDPRQILVTGLTPGSSKLTFTAKDGREEVVEVRVPSDEEPLREQQRKDFLESVKRSVPTANIEAVVMPNNTLVLSGWLATPQDTQVVMAAARAIFGAQANIVDTMRITGVMQIQIECTVALVNRSKIRQAAFNWVINRRNYFVASLIDASTFSNAITAGISAATATGSATPANLPFGIVGDRGSFTGFLTALRTDGLAKIHSEPRITTMSGKAAQFLSGGEVPLVTTTALGAPTITYRSFGTTVTVLPIVLGNGRISLDVAPVLSNRNDGNGVTLPGGGFVPGFDTRGAQVSVQLDDGETLAIGGMIQHSVNASMRKVPVLGDLPYLGAAFSSKQYDEREEELIILVTPRLVAPMACCQLPDRLPPRLTRSPDDFELFLEQLLELPRGPRQTCGPNGHYQAAHKNGPTAGMYPCNDQTPYPQRISLGAHRCTTGCATGGCANGTCATSHTGATGTIVGGNSVATPTASTARVMQPAASSFGQLPQGPVVPAGNSNVSENLPASGPALRLPNPAPVALPRND